MRKLLASFLVFLVATVASAQDLTNWNFESSWSGTPPGWAVQTSGLSSARDTTQVQCGTYACKIARNSVSGTQHFAKEWVATGSAIRDGDVVTAKLRFYVPTSMTGTVYARATGVDANDSNINLGTQTQIAITPANNWQEQTVSYTVPNLTGTNGVRIRIGYRFVNVTSGKSMWTDDIFFQGTSTSFGTLEAPTCTEPDFEITSNGLRLTLGPYRGDIKRIENYPVSLGNYIGTQPASLPVFLFTTAAGSATPHTLSTWTYNYSVIRKTTVGNVTTLTVENGAPGASAPAEASAIHTVATIQSDASKPDLNFSIDITNGYADPSSDYDVIEEVNCPVLKLAPSLSATQPPGPNDYLDDNVLVPGGDGSLTDGTGIREVSSLQRDYPGSASAQLAAYYDGARGLAVASLDTTGECKQIGYSYLTGTENALYLTMKRRYPWVAGRTIHSYPVAITPCSGDWTVAARWYSQRMASAPWLTSNYKTLNPPPAWIDARLPVYNSQFYEMGNGNWLVYPTDWDAVMDAWQTDLGTAMLHLARGFEHYGTYILPFATPLSPDDATATSAWQKLKVHHHTMAMIGGLKWAKTRAQFPPPPPTLPAPGGPAYWVEPFDGNVVDDCGQTKNVWSDTVCLSGGNHSKDDMCIRNKDGNVCLDLPGAGSTWDSEHGYMCPMLLATQQVHSGFAAHLASRFLDLYEFDQMNGGTVKPCYATNHGHDPGYGKWIYESIHGMFQATRVAGRAIDPDFALSMEDPGELYVDVMDLACGRLNHIDGQWPAGATSHSRVVPLFVALYNDRLPGQALDQIIPSANNSRDQALAAVGLSRQFVNWGQVALEIPPWMIYSGYSAPYWPTPNRADVITKTLIKNAVATENGPAHAFFSGRWVSIEGLTMPSYTFTEFSGMQHTVPAASSAAWRSSGGCIGLVLAHARNDATNTTVTQLPTSFDGDLQYQGNVMVDVYRNGVFSVQSQRSALTTLVLGPQEVVFLVYHFNGC